MRTHYDNLHISEKASPEVIRAAYKALAQKWHPDKNPGQREKAERYFKIITQAFDVLSDSALRARYDAWLKEKRSAEPEKPEPEATKEPSQQNSDQTRMAEAWEEGKLSRKQGFKERDCPYSGELAGAWQQGFKTSAPTIVKSSLLGRLWRGEEGLGKTFWLYGVIGINLVTAASFFLSFAVAEDTSDITGIIRFAQNFYVAYFIFISICILKSFHRSLIAPNDSQGSHDPEAQQTSKPAGGHRDITARTPFILKLIAGDLQARHAIIFGSVIPIIALAILFRVAFESPDYEDLVVRVYVVLSPMLLTSAYIIWSAKRLDSGPRKRAIIGASAVWASLVLLIAASF